MTNVFIVSAPSGSGKSTLLRGVLAQDQQIVFSISYTTRKPRGKEQHGKDYFFIARDDFERQIEKGIASGCAQPSDPRVEVDGKPIAVALRGQQPAI